jgi:hexosaminidase
LQAVYDKHGEREVLNPISEFTYEFLNNLIGEVKETFDDEYIHLGMDEVYYRCWESNPNISEWMRENNLSTTRQVEQYYLTRVLTLVSKMKYKSIVWQDVWDNGVKLFDDSILQVWKTSESETWQSYVNRATSEGYRIILSSPWYLNYIKYGSDWYDFYKVDPHDSLSTDEQRALVIGGEACMWSEFVDGTNSLSRLWPRASAVAERLWSSKNLSDVEEAKFRLLLISIFHNTPLCCKICDHLNKKKKVGRI